MLFNSRNSGESMFLRVGRFIVDVLLEQLEVDPTSLAPRLYWALAVGCSVVVWVIAIRVLCAVIKKFFGFYDGRGPRG